MFSFVFYWPFVTQKQLMLLTIGLAKALIAWVRSAFAKISNILIWTEYFVLHQSLDLILLVISGSTEVIP